MSTLVGGASPAALDYLLGVSPQDVDLSLGDESQWRGPEQRRVRRVSGLRLPHRRQDVPTLDKSWRYPTESLLSGMATHAMPIVFSAGMRGTAARFSMGTWSPANVGSSYADAQQRVLLSLLESSYRGVDLDDPDPLPGDHAVGGVALGVPDPSLPERGDGATPWDRMMRALAGTWCEATVVAEPIAEDELVRLRHRVLDELRATAMAEQPFGATGAQPPPLVKHYTTLLEQLLATLNDSLAMGGWRVGVYLLGLGDDYWTLAAAWRGVFTGERSALQPIRSAIRDEAVELSASWALPYSPSPIGPSAWRHPFTAQTLLSSRQLATYVHLPQLEVPGFAVRIVPTFDSVAPDVGDGPAVSIGEVVHRGNPSGTTYEVPLASLARHALVSGATGGGKTNTVFQLLDQIDAGGVPFLVIEPAKSEYRTLMSHPRIGPRLQIFTLGDETTSPIRINPLQPSHGAPLAVHVDMVRSLLTATWHLWEPLPQVLEQALVGVYRDYGWDVATGENERLGDEQPGPETYPTIGDLVDKVEHVVRSLRFDPEAESRVRASLVSRLQSLRAGAKGRMLDTTDPTDIAKLLSTPTVLELERMGDEADRAFVMGLLLIQLGEHRRASGYTDGVKHLLVLEEAHRLLASTGGSGNSDSGDPAQKAIEGFVNLLAEIRVYGEGVVIADQVPVKLHPDAIKNTNLKITHRLLANDDRAAVAGATSMDDQQRDQLPMLRAGQAAVFSDGDDGPVLVQVPACKDLSKCPTDDAVRAHMAKVAPWTSRLATVCTAGCGRDAPTCAGAAELASDSSVRAAASRMLLTAMVDPSAVCRLWPDVEAAALRADASRGLDSATAACLAHRVVSHWVRARGAALGWTYAQQRGVRTAFSDLVDAVVAGDEVEIKASCDIVSRNVEAVHRRTVDPMPGCSAVCDDGLCLFRTSAGAQVARGVASERWTSASALPLEERYVEMLEVGLDVADHALESPSVGTLDDIAVANRRYALCFAQQKVLDDPDRSPTAARFAIEQLTAVFSPDASAASVELLAEVSDG